MAMGQATELPPELNYQSEPNQDRQHTGEERAGTHGRGHSKETQTSPELLDAHINARVHERTGQFVSEITQAMRDGRLAHPAPLPSNWQRGT